MNTDRELMQQALEALLEVNYDQAYAKEVAALRDRRAQPEQEPVQERLQSWEYVVQLLVAAGYVSQQKVDEACQIAKAAKPDHVGDVTKMVPLTDEEFATEWHQRTGLIMGTNKMLLLEAKRVTEDAHGIKEQS